MRYTEMLGAVALAVGAFVIVPSHASAQQSTTPAATDSAAPAKPAPKKAGGVMAGISDAQLCALIKQMMTPRAGGKPRKAADSTATPKAQASDSAAPPKVVAQADTAASKKDSVKKDSASAVVVSSAGDKTGRTLSCK